MKKLFAPDPTRIGRPSGPAMHDAVPESLANGTQAKLRDALSGIVGKENVLHRMMDLVRFASDASPYRYIPSVVVMPRRAEEIAQILEYCREAGHHATFRAAGTSLNGQSQSNDVLIEVRRHWNGCEVINDGAALRTKPGTILGRANSILARKGRRLGPDPASNGACTIGGVIANNSGGMRCTLARDSYHSLIDCTFVLASGTIIDTSAPDAEVKFEKAEPELAQGLMQLRNELLEDRPLVERIKRKYSIRNTHGYRLDALLDGKTPLEIFKRLLVGSEGTLGFISEAVLKTFPAAQVSGVAFLIFPSIDAAIGLVPKLVEMGASAVELMVASALKAAGESFEGTPTYWKQLDQNAAALLVEFEAESDDALRVKEAQVEELSRQWGLVREAQFTNVAEAVELAWHVREGLLGLVGKLRPPGSMLIIEDVCFPPSRLAEGVHDLQALLEKHGFIPGVAGHAAHGNLHFTLVANLENEEGKKKYSAFMHELIELVVRKHDGSLKAEHGTGLNMAPFIADEWGEKATSMMWRIKELADPQGILGPNVILTKNSQIHLESLKSVPTIENISNATHCIECGFCEPVCPSRNVTTTPRQRIVLRREMARQPEDSVILKKLQEDYQYDAIDTCAGDGTCSIQCPIGINTGLLMREFRKLEHSDKSEAIALRVAKNWDKVERYARAGLAVEDIVQRVVGTMPAKIATGIARSIISPDLIPSVPGPMPRPAGKLPATSSKHAAAVYFPACINRMFGRDPKADDDLSIFEALVRISGRAGSPLWIPPDVAGLCCSTPFSSKGYVKAHEYMATSIAEALWGWSDKGRLPVVVDAASCTLGLMEDVGKHLEPALLEKYKQIRIMDSIEWCRNLLPKLQITQPLDHVVLHPTCSMTHLKLTKGLEEIAQKLAVKVETPIGALCCGTAGDRGLLHPELVKSATKDEAMSVSESQADAYLSANRTCEMGMHHATGKPYESFVFALEKLSRTN